MNWAIFVTLILWAVTLTFAFLAWRFLRKDDLSGWGMLCAGVAFMAVFGAVLFPAITFGSRAYGDTACHNWGSQVGVPVKFRVLNWADTGTCFARTPGGRWIPSDNWFSYVHGGK